MPIYFGHLFSFIYYYIVSEFIAYSLKIKGHNKCVIIDLISMRGGEIMREFYSFIITIEAEIVGHLICKWLDSKFDDN